MENNQNEKNLRHEKLKLHFTYIIVICSIICIITIIIAAYNQDAFVSQVSFAGTITSIVLSVIAIWLSISGERTTNDIRIKIAESTERLSDTTKNVETLNKNYEKTMDMQLSELKKVQGQLSNVFCSINSVGEQISHLQEKNTTMPNTIDDDIINTTQRITLFNNIYAWASSNNPTLEWTFCKMIQIFITDYKNSNLCSINEIISILLQFGVNTNYWIRYIDSYWGAINTLLAASVFDDETAVNQILAKVNSILNSVVTSPSLY